MTTDKKQLILDTVLQLVKQTGFYHLNMKAIAEQAGIAAGTIYLYFKSKEELINELYRSIVGEFNEAVLQSYQPNAAVYPNFEAMLRSAVGFYLTRKDFFSFVEQYTYAPFLFKESQDENFSLLLPMYKLMRIGKKQKIIKNIPDVVLIALVHGPLNTILKMHFAHKLNLTQKSIQKRFIQAVWEAISVPAIPVQPTDPSNL
ncbi:MAG: TetR/AcrR family transcriptional regulator [Sphingobacteriales bacterium]|nr:MAG: TetR/AcrR family transcriptional regulator [Sphingobacteriales bacterium]